MNTIKLGAFSISLTVKDIRVSKEFYENLGFIPCGGNLEQNWLIMKNGNALIGLFQGMFDKNIITFNPGWDENANNLDNFNDVREIQEVLFNKEIQLKDKVEEGTTGPGYITLTDPDGNEILIDQHR